MFLDCNHHHFLAPIPEEDGENRQIQGVLLFKQMQNLHFRVRPWSLLPTDNVILMSLLLLVAETTMLNLFFRLHYNTSLTASNITGNKQKYFDNANNLRLQYPKKQLVNVQ